MRTELIKGLLFMTIQFTFARIDNSSPKDIVVNSLTALLGTTNTTNAVQSIETYFSPGYVQHTNTDILDYASFVQHIQDLKIGLLRSDLRIKTIIGPMQTSANSSLEYQVGSYHHITLEYGNETMSSDVIALFGLRDGKIVECHEVTQ
ncbi:hypothetical protein PVAR5_6593 [Paecilomyces variotii No. 5]|uniref:SnoaL-like domain-containing protein n=1 Tax=Byssochlamys spectabilis (strain No. 5 / NBRC 109023) TaxID=1356009 RepID=V5GAH3_BYSSN|nr:hypothetical protein PVAR5_6593 [Paecilomyces variotii No. 5]